MGMAKKRVLGLRVGVRSSGCKPSSFFSRSFSSFNKAHSLNAFWSWSLRSSGSSITVYITLHKFCHASSSSDFSESFFNEDSLAIAAPSLSLVILVLRKWTKSNTSSRKGSGICSISFIKASLLLISHLSLLSDGKLLLCWLSSRTIRLKPLNYHHNLGKVAREENPGWWFGSVWVLTDWSRDTRSMDMPLLWFPWKWPPIWGKNAPPSGLKKVLFLAFR